MFEAALKEMQQSGQGCWGPRGFQDYCRENGFRAPDTAQFISVDTRLRLQPELVKAECMVFRLGIPEGERNTQFGLAKCVDGWEDYFLLDDWLFRKVPPEMFLPTAPARHLFPFQLLPTFTETSLVNLALASGLMGHALRLEEPDLALAAATGQSTLSFQFRPHEQASAVWAHGRGQVEIDSLFTARREGRETVFIVESKAGAEFDCLAKHKLLYPMLAIRQKVPSYMPVVPVYLRVVKEADGYHFYFAECKLELGKDGVAVLSNLKPVVMSHFVIGLFQWSAECSRV